MSGDGNLMAYLMGDSPSNAGAATGYSNAAPVPQPADSYGIVEEHMQPALYSDRYANTSNFAEAARHLSASLMAMGLPVVPTAITVSQDGPVGAQDRADVVNCVHALLTSRTGLERKRDELSARVRKLEADLEGAADRLHKAKEALVGKDRDLWEVEQRRRTEEKQSLEQHKKLKRRVLELEKQNRQVKNRDNQYKHELRKREKEARQLQDRLQRAMSGDTRGKTHSNSSGAVGKITVMNGKQPQQAGRERSKWASRPTSKVQPSAAELSLLRGLLKSAEEKEQALLEDNERLRASMKVLFDKLRPASGRSEGADTGSNDGAEDDESKPEDDDEGEEVEIDQAVWEDFDPVQLDMPADLVCSTFEIAVSQRVKALKAEARTAEGATAAQEVEVMRAEMEEMKALIHDQDALLQNELFGDALNERAMQMLEEQRRWSMESEIEQEKAQLADERGNLARTASSVDEARRQLTKEKSEFELQRARWIARYADRVHSVTGTPSLASPLRGSAAAMRSASKLSLFSPTPSLSGWTPKTTPRYARTAALRQTRGGAAVATTAKPAAEDKPTVRKLFEVSGGATSAAKPGVDSDDALSEFKNVPQQKQLQAQHQKHVSVANSHSERADGENVPPPSL